MHTSGQEKQHARLAELSRLGAVRRRSARVEPTFFQRFECKYLVDSLGLPGIRDFLKPFVRPDAFSALRPDHRYVVSSLYIDTEDLLLYQQTQAGEKDRFKLRIRTYSDEPNDPAYLEVKRKVNRVVHKRRVGLSRSDARALLSGQRSTEILRGLGSRRQADADYFCHHVERTSAKPVVRVQYMREAFEATGNEPVRVTLDTELRHAVTLDAEFGHTTGDWVTTPLAGTIVEIKFTERFPWWVAEFIRRFELRQRSVPKYIMSIEHALQSRYTSTVSRTALGFPSRRV